MDELWEAPAKLNVTLRVGRPRSDGMHPLESIVQAIDWTDDLRITEAEEDSLEIEGADLPTDGENLVWKAAQRFHDRPRLSVVLTKRIPHGGGLGGGSSDAAAVIEALGPHVGVDAGDRREIAASVGADVPFFLTGGTARMEGVGERITRLDPLEGLVAVVGAPSFSLATPDVYRRWDRMGHPKGRRVESARLPPALRHLEIVNDLTPAAIDLAPELGDLLESLGRHFERPVMMSGSGSAVFAWFADLDEAQDAASGAGGLRVVRAVSPIRHGVRVVER